MWSGVLARFVPFEYQTCMDVPLLYPQLTLHLQHVTYTKIYVTTRGEDMTSHTLTAYTYFPRDWNQNWLLSAVRRSSGIVML